MELLRCMNSTPTAPYGALTTIFTTNFFFFTYATDFNEKEGLLEV